MRLRLFPIGLLFFCMLFRQAHAFGQMSSYDEIWPEINVYYRFNQQFRVMAKVSFTKGHSGYTEGNFASYFDYFAPSILRKPKEARDSVSGYYQWYRMGYLYRHSTPGGESEFTEHMIQLESNTRFRLPVQLLVTAKNRLDTRIYNGDLRERYRAQLRIERNCKTLYLTFTPYIYGEYYWNLNKSGNDRIRLCIGSELWIARDISFELYYVRQFQYETPQLNAVGMSLNFYFKPREKKKKEVDPDEAT